MWMRTGSRPWIRGWKLLAGLCSARSRVPPRKNVAHVRRPPGAPNSTSSKQNSAKARSDRKAKLQAQIDHLRARMEKKLEQDQARSKQSEDALQARVQALQKKADKEQGDAKATIEARITRLRDDYQRQQHA